MVTGPTGSGKTTTLYSGLHRLDRKRLNILTVEDPVEYDLGGVGQTQMNSKIGLTFATGLRSILRQDPDVVLVGEIRDLETAEISVQASLTWPFSAIYLAYQHGRWRSNAVGGHGSRAVLDCLELSWGSRSAVGAPFMR